MREVQADCLIIGGGPAGLTAATYLGRFRRNVLLIDSGASRASWIPVSHNLIGFSHGVTGPDLLKRMQDQVDQYGARRIAGEVEALKRLPDGSFSATWQDGRVLAAKVLLATGGLDVEPRIRDARRAVKDGLIRHCPICDAYEASGRRVGLVAYGRCRIKEALLLRGYTADLTVLTLGHPTELSPEDTKLLQAAGIRIIPEAIERLSRENDKIAAWQEAARGLSRDIEAEICDDRGQVLSLHAFAAIGQELNGLYDALAARDVPAGSLAARRLFSEALHHTSANPAFLPVLLHSLGDVLTNRYEQTGEIKDLERSIEYYRDAVARARRDHPHGAVGAAATGASWSSSVAPIAPPRSPSAATCTSGGRKSANRCGSISSAMRFA